VPDGITVDSSEINLLASDLGNVPSVAGRFIRQAVEVSARRVKDDWKEAATGFPTIPAFPYSVSYDVSAFSGFGATVVQAEIGPDKEKSQGALGNLIEFGSEHNEPMGLGAAALQHTEEDFERGLEKATRDAERLGGL